MNYVLLIGYDFAGHEYEGAYASLEEAIQAYSRVKYPGNWGSIYDLNTNTLVKEIPMGERLCTNS